MNTLRDIFLNIKTRTDLANFLGISENALNYYCRKKLPAKNYNTFPILKKNGAQRFIYAPNGHLKYIQKKIANALLEIYEPKKIVHGFIKEHSIVTNAKTHINKTCILNIDLENFFESIHFGRVLGMFTSTPFSFSREIAICLARLVCYNGFLPQGSPASPIISNIICRKLDNQLIKLTSNYKFLCTRYCDDITISTKSLRFPSTIVTKQENGRLVLGEELAQIFTNNAFSVNKNKLRLSFNYSRQMVTGLVVNENINILQKKYRKFRNIMHYTFLNGLSKGALRNKYTLLDGTPDTITFFRFLKGTINYFKMVLGKHNLKYQKLAIKFNALVKNSGIQSRELEIPDTFESLVNNYVYIIENDDNQGTAFMLKDIGIVTCAHNIIDIGRNDPQYLLEYELRKRLSSYKIYSPSNKQQLIEVSLVSLHYTEDLVILKPNISFNTGFELSKKVLTNRSSYKNLLLKAIGYPEYSTTSSICVVDDIKITQDRTQCDQKLFIVDKSFYHGASGGPVFDAENKVIGYIDRGNGLGEKEENMSAICALTPLLVK